MHSLTGDNHSDKELIDRALINDPVAFRKIISKSERMLAQIIHRMVADEEDRKDLAQEIYLKAFRKLTDFKYEAKLTTWICQIGYNTCIDFLRKKKIRPLFRQDLEGWQTEEADDTGKDQLTGDHFADTATTKKELSAILKSEIARLSPVYQTLVTLF
ncbi:MAG: sigma-70 family RNA polymerase sigma factor, partial [Chitinophagaceae bacterium]